MSLDDIVESWGDENNIDQLLVNCNNLMVGEACSYFKGHWSVYKRVADDTRVFAFMQQDDAPFHSMSDCYDNVLLGIMNAMPQPYNQVASLKRAKSELNLIVGRIDKMKVDEVICIADGYNLIRTA
jgi:hypothetical protein